MRTLHVAEDRQPESRLHPDLTSRRRIRKRRWQVFWLVPTYPPRPSRGHRNRSDVISLEAYLWGEGLWELTAAGTAADSHGFPFSAAPLDI